jgi:hypothetical protein
VNRNYDIFEILSDGVSVWRAAVSGHDAGILKLRELAAQTKNEVRLMHMPTKAVIATINAPPLG